MKLSMLVAGAVGLGLNVALSPAVQAEVTEVILNIPNGQTKTYTVALKDLGYDAYPGDLPLTKTGEGTLVADNACGNVSITPTKILEGVLESPSDQSPLAFGKRNSTIWVYPGATLRAVGTGMPVLSRTLHVGGDGAPGEGGALRATGGCQLSSNQYHFDCTDANGAYVDATFASDGDSTSYMLRGSGLWFYGNTLTLTGKGWGHSLLDQTTTFRGTGRIRVKGVKFAITRANVTLNKTTNSLTKDPAYLVLELVDGGEYYSVQAAGFPLFDEIEADSDCTIGCHPSEPSKVAAVVKCWKGAPTVKDGITSLTVSDRLTVRVSDLKKGHALSMKGALAFGANAKLVVEGDLDEVLDVGGTAVTIAAAEGGVTGLPAVETTSGTKNWRLAASADGKSIVFNYQSHKPEGAIDACAEWMILPGADQAADNAAKFNAAMAACADNATVFFPVGNYYFAAPLTIGAKTGVTVLGEGRYSVLHLTDATATSVLSVSGANGLTLKDLAFADCTGVAVSASGTTGLTVKDCWYKAIGGAIAAVDGTYPVSIANGADSFVRANQTVDGATYTAHVHLDGGSVLPLSEPVSNAIVLSAAADKREDFATVFARSGRKASSLAKGDKIYKVGAGTLVGSNDYVVDGVNIATLFGDVDIEAGTLVVAHANDCCKNAGEERIDVRDGATLCVEGRDNGTILVSRKIYVQGIGAADRKGAIEIGTGANSWGYTWLTFVLTGDATFYNVNETGVALLFRNANINTSQGYVLTLKAATKNSGFSFAYLLTTLAGTGAVVADGITLSDAGLNNPDKPNHRNPNSNIDLKLVNGTVFTPSEPSIFTTWRGIEMDATSSINAKNAGCAAEIGDWTGCGTIGANVASLTITNSLTVKAADLKAGNHLTVAGALVTRPEVRVTLEDAASLNALKPGDAQPPFAFAASATSISAKPRKASGCDFAGWSVKDGEDGLSWAFDHTGLTVIIR